VLRNRAREYLAPVAAWAHFAWDGFFVADTVASRATLLEEIIQLRGESDRLRERDALFEALYRENESLRKLARFAALEVGITAPVLSSFWSSPYGTFIIGAGTDSGIAIGDAVLSEEGLVLGQIADAGDRSSVVRMAFAPGASVEAVSGETGFLIEGRGLGNGRARVPRDALVTLRDPVFAAQFGSRQVGIIGAIESASSSAYADLYIVTPVNFNAIRIVYVVTQRPDAP
jgi:hypothetical protein